MAESETNATAAENTNQTAGKKKTGLIAGIIAAGVALVAIILIVVFAFAGKGNIVGTYDLTGMIEDGEDQSSTIENLKSYNLSATLELRSDKTGTLSFFGTDSQITYDDKQFTYVGNSEGESDTCEYSFDGQKITLKTSENSEMTFTKRQ